jgi:uncharacterized protein (DUF1778 family)
MAAPRKTKTTKPPDDGTTVINIRLTADLKARLEKAAASRAMSVSAFLRDAAIEEMNRRGL